VTLRVRPAMEDGTGSAIFLPDNCLRHRSEKDATQARKSDSILYMIRDNQSLEGMARMETESRATWNKRPG